MMYGFGDDIEPVPESVELVEQYLVEYLSNLCSRTIGRSLRGGHNSMQLGDLIHFLYSDPKKYYRIPHSQVHSSKHSMFKTNSKME